MESIWLPLVGRIYSPLIARMNRRWLMRFAVVLLAVALISLTTATLAIRTGDVAVVLVFVTLLPGACIVAGDDTSSRYDLARRISAQLSANGIAVRGAPPTRRPDFFIAWFKQNQLDSAMVLAALETGVLPAPSRCIAPKEIEIARWHAVVVVAVATVQVAAALLTSRAHDFEDVTGVTFVEVIVATVGLVLFGVLAALTVVMSSLLRFGSRRLRRVVIAMTVSLTLVSYVVTGNSPFLLLSLVTATATAISAALGASKASRAFYQCTAHTGPIRQA